MRNNVSAAVDVEQRAQGSPTTATENSIQSEDSGTVTVNTSFSNEKDGDT